MADELMNSRDPDDAAMVTATWRRSGCGRPHLHVAAAPRELLRRPGPQVVARANSGSEGGSLTALRRLLMLHSKDADEWEAMIESLANAVLWDNDFDSEETFLDFPRTRRMRLCSRRSQDDCFLAVAPGRPTRELAEVAAGVERDLRKNRRVLVHLVATTTRRRRVCAMNRPRSILAGLCRARLSSARKPISLMGRSMTSAFKASWGSRSRLSDAGGLPRTSRLVPPGCPSNPMASGVSSSASTRIVVLRQRSARTSGPYRPEAFSCAGDAGSPRSILLRRRDRDP